MTLNKKYDNTHASENTAETIIQTNPPLEGPNEFYEELRAQWIQHYNLTPNG